MLPSKRPWWDRIAFSVVPIVGGLGTHSFLSHYSSLGWGFRLAIAVAAGCLLIVGCSLILDKLRRRFGQ
jgi:hypothetical protein